MGDGICLNCEATPCQSWGQDMVPFCAHLCISFSTYLGVKLLSSYHLNCGRCWIDTHMCWCSLMCKWPNLLQSPSKPFVQEQVSTPAVLWWCFSSLCYSSGFLWFQRHWRACCCTHEWFSSYLNHGPCCREQGWHGTYVVCSEKFCAAWKHHPAGNCLSRSISNC